MSRNQRKSIDPDLHAYADGLLDVPARRVIEAYLADNPAVAREVEGWRRQNDTLRALYGPVFAEPVPPRLDIHCIERESRAAAGRWWRMAAAAVFLLAAGAATGWYANGSFAPAGAAEVALAEEAIKAHRLYAGEVAHTVEVRAGEKDHLKAWLSRRLARALTIPDLSASGLTLVGGRLLPATSGPAAQVMYEDTAGRRVTLYAIAVNDGGETSFRHVAGGGPLEAFVWTDETISCAIVGDFPKDRLLEIATIAYRQLE